MKANKRLTEGSIFKALVKLAIPIMGTSFVEMAYNMTDMIWVGRVGSDSVTSVGTAGFFTWLAIAFILIPKIGAEVGVAQSVGKDDIVEARKYIRHTIQLNVVLAIIYGLVLLIFRRPLIGFFNLEDSLIINDAISYLVIVSFGMIFYFMNPLFTGILNGYGDSKTPFVINTVGLVTNMILDPLLILVFGLGVKGAAIATVIAQFIVTITFLYKIKDKKDLFGGLNLLKVPDMYHLKSIVKLGFPVALQSGLFAIFAMVIARIISGWGPTPLAVQKVGSQIEALSWRSAGGFSTALSTFVGQNYGAKKWDRIYRGYFIALSIVATIGLLTTCLLVFGARPVFALFIPEKEAIEYGVVYLRILGLSQVFMTIEIATAGAFNGLGKTIPPSLVSILFTGLRIPAAIILSSEDLLGLNGVWWSISMSSVFKGVILTGLFIILLARHRHLINREVG